MLITTNTLARMSGKATNDNMHSVIEGLALAGIGAGLNRPHRLAMYLAQLGHESEWFKYDREIWGPTEAQKRYEGRKDLGNTEPGDGSKFRGHTAAQITGRANTTDFRDWCRRIDPRAPDFVANPGLMNTDPWEGLGPIWYWSTRDLNDYADANNIEMVTRRINGGLNGYSDRLARYVRTALVLAGYAPTAVKAFQQDAGLDVDGIAGPKTRAALHDALEALPLVAFTDDTPVEPDPDADAILAAILPDIKALIERALKG